MKIPPLAVEVLRVAAPTLLAALSTQVPPFGAIGAGIAGAALRRWLPAAAAEDAQGAAPKATPAQIVAAVEQNASDGDLIFDLRKAEIDLQRFQEENDFRFAELEVRDREDARAFARDSGTAPSAYGLGWSILAVDAAVTVLALAGGFLLLSGRVAIADQNVVLAVFTLVGGVVGRISARADVFVNFVFGSSQSSKDKSDAIAGNFRDLGSALADKAQAPPAPPPPSVVVVPQQGPAPPDGIADGGSTAPQPLPPQPATPVPSGLLVEAMAELVAPHRQYEGSVSWCLTPAGVSIDGAPAEGTAGAPASVRKVWALYGTLMATAAKRYGLGVEAIVATALTESNGNPSARRAEPQIADQSVGLMQTLVATARMASGNRSLQADDLLAPETSINAGAAYMASQRSVTHLDPPKVAVAYNSGSIRRDDGAANRWKMRCYPIGTGAHADRWVAWFNDAMRVSAEQGWGKDGVPSYVTALAAFQVSASESRSA